MVKLKDVVWGEVDLIDESLLSDDEADTEGKGEVVLMCCGYRHPEPDCGGYPPPGFGKP